MNTPAYRQQWILEELKKEPLLSFGEVFTLYLQNFTKKITRQTLSKDYNKAKSELEAYQKKAKEVKERESLKMEKEAVKMGLKPKFERALILQKLVDDCLRDLSEGMTNDTYFQDGQPTDYRRKMTLLEYNQTRKTLKDLQTEISKIEGDYATIKHDHTTKGEAINPISNIVVEIIPPPEDE